MRPGHPGDRRHTDVQSAAVGSGAVRGLRGPPLPRHVVVAHLPRAVQEDRPVPQHGLAALARSPAATSWPTSRRPPGPASTGCATTSCTRDDELRSAGPPDDVFARIDRIAGTARRGQRRDLHALALRRAHPGRRPHDPGRAGSTCPCAPTARDLVRAVLEGVAFNTRWLLGCVEKFCGRPFPWINLIGGGGQSELWCQIHADVLDRPIRRVEHPIRANARGAALLAGVALGRVGVDELDAKVKVVAVHEPNQTHRRTYDEQYGAFRAIYKQNKGIHRRLNAHG